MAQITVNGLALGYEGNTVAENINFTVESGDYLCIVGENGSGKSTLMKTLLGLEMPIRGDISFGDGLTQKDVGYLPQQTPVQRDFPASVKEIVLSGCIGKMKGAFYGAAQKEKAAAAMGKMGISHLASRCYRELSGGQQQRVLLARALCAAGKILLLDEPTAGLDPKVTAEMYELIYDLNRKDKITVIMISHDIDAARRYAGKILHIGSSVFFGSTEEYMKSDMGKRFTGGEKNDR